MHYRLLPALCALALLFSACGTASPASGEQERSLGFFAMDTYMNIRAWGADEALPAELEAVALDLEARLSVTREDSEVARLNREGSAQLSEDTAGLLRRALALCAETGGALDVTVYPVVRAWGFTLGEEDRAVPPPEELAELLSRVDYRAVTLEGNRAALPAGAELDLGAVAKGYTGDRMAAALRDAGVQHALLDLGGNIHTLGTKPDGSDWHVAIQDPRGEGLLGVLSVSDRAVITSGGYERYFVDENGELWWHIMDPATGYPARNGLISVTVVGGEGLVCDALSTALFVMGPERASEFWRAHRDWDVELVLVTENGTVLLTPGLSDRFSLSSGDYGIQVIPDG